MLSNSETKSNAQIRTYKRAEAAIFSKTKEAFGGLSNMAAGFPIRINGVRILTSEALYQACRFPHLQKVQRVIIGQFSPMTAKMKSKLFRKDSRPDWDRVRVKIMRWCLRVKLAQNWNKFSQLLISTGERAIVEESRKDDFWGAKVVDEDTLIGMNVLGRLLMELREEVRHRGSEEFSHVEPLPIADFLLYGEPILAVEIREAKIAAVPYSSLAGEHSVSPYQREPERIAKTPRIEQPTLFDSSFDAGKRLATGNAMIDGLRPYPEYRELGQAWLGAVPKHWEVLPNRAIFGEVKDRNHSDEEMLSVTITKGIVRQKTLLAASSKKDSSKQDKSAYKLVCPNDLAYNKMRAWQGAIGVSEFRGIISPAYVTMRLRGDHNPRYFHHLYRTPHFAKEAERWSYGITSDMWSLRPEHFKMIYTPLPPGDEQAAIVQFLDYANRWQERMVRVKRKVIALLNEQKQAVIYRAVTRGLDSSVPVKPAGILWLGDIPRHWEIFALKRVIRPGTSISYGIVQPGDHAEGGIPFLQTTNISKYRLSLLSLQRTTKEIEAAYPRSRLQANDVVLGIRASIGAAHVVPPELAGVNLSRGVARIVVGKGLRSDYLVLFLRSRAAGEYWEYARQGTTFNEVSIETVRTLPVLVPPISEQEVIVESTRARCQSLEITIDRTEREIVLLREFHARLVADVVTGKLDVRVAARDLQAEPEEPEATLDANTDDMADEAGLDSAIDVEEIDA